MTFNALVLAGSRGGIDPVAEAAGVSAKALATVAGEPMLARVVAALRAAGAGRIAVSASDDDVVALARALGVEAIAAGPGPSGSAADGLALLGAPLLLTTADHALLEPDWIEHLLAHRSPGADVAVMLARREAIEAAVPDTRRTYLRFADGDWSGCNLFLLATPNARRALQLWTGVERDRKRPWRIVRRLGPGVLLRYVLGRLTLAEGVALLGARAGVTAQVVESPAGLAAVDVDKPDDLALVRRIAEGDPAAGR